MTDLSTARNTPERKSANDKVVTLAPLEEMSPYDPLALAYSRRNAPLAAQTIATLSQKSAVSLLLLGVGLCMVCNLLRGVFPFLEIWADILFLFASAPLVVLMILPALHRVSVYAKNFQPLDYLFPRGDVARNDGLLPRYTVLVPLYREGNVVRHTLKSLERIDYPEDRLEVLLLIEGSDSDTRNALPSNLPAHFRIIDIPTLPPRSKPRVLNHGLEQATGEFLVVYDAECLPEPEQLRNAVRAHEEGGEETWAVQAKLRYDNPEDSWLSQLFCSEIAFWFDYYLPYLSSKGYPIPLGGSSNHFKTCRLREIGGWDAFNVTEDADMTLRIYERGGRIGLMESETLQRSPTRAKTWVKQRTRWVKGFIQTLLVHSRRESQGRFGAYFLFCMSGSLLVVYASLFLALSLCAYGSPFNYPIAMVGLVGILASFLGQLVMCFGSLKNYREVRVSGLTVLRRFLFPGILVYWFLYLVANARALYQLLTNPFYWDKTDHSKEA
jgi:cellulose synthase/poly-beta-1,6-N-acetylglucosamine synthase-like glycosyltransferase